MGKVVSKLANIVSVAALVVGTIYTGGALLYGASVAGFSGAVAAVKAATLGITALRVAAFAGAIGAALNKPKLDIGQTTRQRTELNLNPSPDRKWVFGKTAAAMDMIYAEVYGSDGQTTTMVIAHAGHLITSYQRLWIDGELVTWSGDNATGNWQGLLSRQQRLGATDQTAVSINSGARWKSDDKAAGVAVQALTFTANQEKNPRGVPSRMVQEIEASPVYDPRLDSTEGGTGSHRADDQSTWEYANSGTDIGRNAALAYLAYLIGWRDSGDLVLGVGIPVSEILYDTFIEAANVCEANGWYFDGALADSDGHGRNLRAILDAMAGEPLEIGGKFGIRVPFDDTASVALAVTGDRIMGQIQRMGSPPFSERVNIAVGRYIEPENAYQPEEYPGVEMADLIGIDGTELQTTMDFLGTQDPDTAQQLAGVKMMEMRQPKVRLTLDQTGLAVQPGEIISITLAEAGMATTKVRVKTHDFDFTAMTVNIEGRIVKSSDYDLVTPGAAADSLTPSLSRFDELAAAVNLTGLSAVAATISTLFTTVVSTERFGFAIQWDSPGVDILETQIQYRPDGETDWINAPSAIGDTNGDPNTAIIPGIEADTDYDIRARHINLYGFPGDWQQITASSTVTTLNSPTNLALTENLQLGSDGQYRTSLALTFDPPADDLHIRSFEAQYVFLPQHGSSNWQPLFNSLNRSWDFPITDLGQYQVRIRTVYIQDILYSDWAEVSATALGTYQALTVIGLNDPVDPKLFITLDQNTNRATLRVMTSYDKTGDPVEPEYFVVFYSADDYANQIGIDADNGSTLTIGAVDILGTYDRLVTAGSTTKEVKFNGAGLDVDLSGVWWFQIVRGGTEITPFYKVVRADSTTLAINPAENMAVTPIAGDTVRIAEIAYHDSRIAEFRLGYIYDPDNPDQPGEVVKISSLSYDSGSGRYLVNVAARGAEGTTQADATGKTLAYYPAYGIDTEVLVIPVEDFSVVGDTIEYSNNVALNVPANFAWSAVTCCFVRAGTQDGGVKWVRSNIVDLEYAGEA